MTIEYRTGDLFKQTDLPAIGHGVNCTGKMGSGIAITFRRLYPELYKEYHRLCLENQLKLGDIFPWKTLKGNWIYNLASQYYIGRDARIDAIESSVQKMFDHTTENNVHAVGLPRIGAGIGGLRWSDVNNTIRMVAENHPTKIVIVTQPDTR